ncbi:MAG: hypothetical protein DLM68_00915 [Hyphomicrobiales bacterium]|nr:MAG: hypothetical protein DLM68_00915 [Hyphomicrobiales bacterium]
MLNNIHKHLAGNSKILILTILGLVLGGMPAAAGPEAATIWFAPRNQPPIPAPDFMNLFQPSAPWPRAASHVKIFKLYPQFVANASDADLRSVIVGLRQRHIALAIEYGLLNRNDPVLCGGKGPQCGQVEGFDGELLANGLAHLKSLGANLQYVAMDEPLWFGTVSTEPGAPQASISAIAQDIAMQIAIVHSYFPKAQVGDIEPVVGAGGPANWTQLIMQWANAYQSAVGQPLAFFHSDVAWQGTGWSGQLTELQALLHAVNIPFGIIYDGNYSDDAVEWTTAAEQKFAGIETNSPAVPDHAILQSWNPQPLDALPETQPGTMTYVVDRYAAAETVINATETNGGFTGTLTSQGTPVAGAKIFAYAVDDGTLNITTTASFINTVPFGAATALVGSRINTECNCNGPANVLLGSALYVDQTSNTTITTNVVSPSQRVVVAVGQTMSVHSTPFPVTPGDAVSFSVPMQVPYSSSNSGYVAIVFFNGTGAEIERLNLPFQPGQRLIGANTTNSMGQFTITTKPPTLVMFNFSGNPNLRLSSALWRDDLPSGSVLRSATPKVQHVARASR